MNFLDRTILTIAPAWGFRRMKARTAATGLSEVIDKMEGKSRRYDAASRGRRTKGWKASGTSANAEIARDGFMIRNRARDLIRNNPWARKAARVFKTNVVGSGIKISIQPTTKAKSAKTQADKAKGLWREWAESTACDFYKHKNLYGIQRQIIHAAYVDGEVLVRQRRNASLFVPVELQVLEIDYLDTTKSGVNLNGNGYIDQGVEMDGDGRVVAYWIYQQHPGHHIGFGSITSVRVPRAEILHIYSEERPGQIRGVSEMVASMLRLRDLDEYEDAQLIRQKIAACFSVFIHGDDTGLPGEANRDSDGYDLERVEPGMIEYLPAGKQVSFASPPEAQGYDEFVRRILQGTTAGFGITYEAGTNDYSNVNFSSARMGWLEQNRVTQEWQDDVVRVQFCANVWKWFLDAARVKNKLPQTAKYVVSWTAPRREMIDPVKETQGLKEQVRAGFTSLQDVIRQMGGDPEEVMAKIAEDRVLQDAFEAMFTTDPRHDPARKSDEPAESEAAKPPKKAKD